MQERPVLHLDQFKMWKGFKKNKGEKCRKVSRPLLTEQHKETWLTYSRVMLERLEEEEEVNFYEDEKWAYEESRRKSSKYLPCANFEEAGADRLQVRWDISKQHPTKAMFMEVVGTPNNQQNFDGKIAMKDKQTTYTTKRYLPSLLSSQSSCKPSDQDQLEGTPR